MSERHHNAKLPVLDHSLFFSEKRQVWGMRVFIGEQLMHIVFHKDLCKLMIRFADVETFRVEASR
jgi:hypothetical protein